VHTYLKEDFSVADWVRVAVRALMDKISKISSIDAEMVLEFEPRTWNEYHDILVHVIAVTRGRRSPVDVDDATRLLHGMGNIREHLCGIFSRDLAAIQQKRPHSTPKDAAKFLEAIYAIDEIREYLLGVEGLLMSRQAQTWNEIYPDRKTESNNGERLLKCFTPTKPQFRDSRRFCLFGGTGLAQHSEQTFDELYEACFIGDNEKIKQLCFPPEGSDIQPLQISVNCVPPDRRIGVFGNMAALILF
jgi:hypothetical protein